MPMNPWPGFFVVFEGPDSVGKTTLLNRVARTMVPGRLKWCPPIIETCEPSYSSVGKKIRELLQAGTPSKDLLDLFLEDRKLHVEQEILPALNAGNLVLCDRYKYSTIAYQSLQGHPIEKLIELNQSFPVPDVTFILYLSDPKEVEKRLMREEQNECFDTIEYFWWVQRNYYRIPWLLPHETFVPLDAFLPPEELVVQVWRTIKGMFEAKKASKIEHQAT